MASTIEEAIDTLLKDASTVSARKAAVHFLQHNPSKEGIEALIKTLRDRDSGVRWASSTALVQLGEQALVPLLRAIGGTDNDAMLREGAHYVLVHNSSPEVRAKTKELQESLVGPGAQLSSMEAATKLILQA